ncbi:MAG: PD40 domain-containing protein [Victivallales bacterium]|nr:PD40 domain-containing protein [Victivallales bacterium]
MKTSFAILCWSALLVSAAALKPLRVDYFRQGCGTDRQGTYYSPVVADDGALAVIAPYHAETYDPEQPQRCGYWIGADGKAVTQMFAPGAEFMGIVFFRALDFLASDAARSCFWGVSFHFTGGTNIAPFLHHYDLAVGQESDRKFGVGYSQGLLMRLLPNAEGTAAFLHVVDDTDEPLPVTGLYALDGSAMELQQAIALPHDLGFAPACTADGTAVFYIGENPAASTDTQKILALYRYVIADGTAELLEDIGPRTSLKVYESRYLKAMPMVVANADGTVVAYRWANGNTTAEGGVQLRVAAWNAVTGGYEFEFASRLSGTEEILMVDSTEGGNTVDCQFPAISADGRYIAFTARATNAPNGATCRRAWRYDRQDQRLECLSDGISGDCHATALSPSGRHAAFVAPDASTSLHQVYRVDCGPAITLKERLVVLRPGESMELDMTAVSTANATITVAGEFSGILETAEGDEVLANTPYSVATLPWQFTAGGAGENGTIAFTVTEGAMTASAELSIIVSNFNNLTTSVLPRSTNYSYAYSDIHFSADGRQAVFLTDAPLVPGDDAHNQDVYRLTLATGKLELLTGGLEFAANVYAPQLSGDGRNVYWTDLNGAFWKNGVTRLLAAEADRYVSPAVSYDGSVVVLRQGNALLRSIDGGATFETLAVPGASADADYKSPMLSYDGGVMAFTVEDGDALALYVLDGTETLRKLPAEISALEGLTQDGESALVRRTDGTFAWISVGNEKLTAIAALPPNAREVSLAGNGRFVAYTAPSSADATRPGIWLCDLGKGVNTEITSAADGASSAPVLAASGKQLLFASDATNLIDGLADTNEENDLFLYTHPGWKNALPGAPISMAPHSLQEDPPQPLLFRLGLQDNDNDALVPVLTTDATLGTARLVPPCEGQLDYRLCYLPPKDFCGTDSVRLRVWDGTGWGAPHNLMLEIQNVNDPPVWDEDTPVSLELQAGGAIQVTLHATDVDEANPEPDVLEYALSGEVPLWATIGPADGVLTLRPGFADAGELTLAVQVTDGTATAEHEIAVTVTAPGEYEVPLELLRDGGELPPGVAPESALGQWLAAFAGCWVAFDDGWQALSLPGDADIAELCAALGCEQIWLYSTGMYCTASEGTLPAGIGFWAKVAWPDDGESFSLFLTPVLARPGELPRFCGPLVDEMSPAGLRGVDGGAWVNCPDWQLGRGYFTSSEE